ncbi:MAG: hypothetical protein K2X82_08315 [Gemmataceae bacterium]|nr:hypothetical protein [Gemmataceae bacterium]
MTEAEAAAGQRTVDLYPTEEFVPAAGGPTRVWASADGTVRAVVVVTPGGAWWEAVQ